jgi:2-dehydropantoate 2-reductase
MRLLMVGAGGIGGYVGGRRAVGGHDVNLLARGVDLPPDVVDRPLAFVDALRVQTRPSLLPDLTEGRRLEAPWLSGAVVRMAAENGLEVPITRTLYAALKPYLDGAPRQ